MALVVAGHHRLVGSPTRRAGTSRAWSWCCAPRRIPRSKPPWRQPRRYERRRSPGHGQEAAGAVAASSGCWPPTCQGGRACRTPAQAPRAEPPPRHPGSPAPAGHRRRALDNTLIFYIWGDNGSGMEGTNGDGRSAWYGCGMVPGPGRMPVFARVDDDVVVLITAIAMVPAWICRTAGRRSAGTSGHAEVVQHEAVRSGGPAGCDSMADGQTLLAYSIRL